MIGHSLLFNEKTGEPMIVARGEFTLNVDRKAKNLRITISPLPPVNETFFFIWEGTSRLLVYEAGKEQQRIAAILGDGLTVPLAGEEEIAAAISAIAPFVIVHSDVAAEDGTLTTVDADSRVHVLLRPHGGGIVFELLIRPLGEDGPGFYPGRGSATVIAAIKQQRVQTTRHLKREKTLLQELLAAGRDWFSVEGSVSISDTDVLSLQQLLELSSAHKGRFMPLADGEFVALTEEFRRKLVELRRMVERHGKESRFHPLAAALVDEALHGTSLKGDKLWKSTLERFKSSTELEPKLPATFQATLRDYQLEGFAWLARLAHWGVIRGGIRRWRTKRPTVPIESANCGRLPSIGWWQLIP